MFENTDSMHSAAFDAVMARKGRTNHCTLDRTLHSGDWISQQNKVFPDLREYCQIQSVYWEGDRLMVKLPQYMQIPGRADDVCKLQPDPTPDSKGYLDESAGVHLTLMFGDYELIADDGEVRPAKTKTIAKKPQKTEQVNEQSKASLMSHLKPKIQPPISTNSSVSTVVQSGSSGNKKRKQIVCSQSQSDTQSQSQTQSQTLSLTSSTESKSSSNGTSSKAAKTSNSSRSSQSTAPSLISISSSRRGATSETMRNRLAGILLERQDMVMDEAGPDATITHLYKITWAEVEKTAAKIDFANLFSKDLDHAFYPVDEISQAFDQLFDVRLEPKDLNRTMNRTALIGALTVQFLAFYSGSL